MRLLLNSNLTKPSLLVKIFSDPLSSHFRSSSSSSSSPFLKVSACVNPNPSSSPMTSSTIKSALKPMALDNEEGIARRFWKKFKRESVLAIYSPFVVCLASGNLKLETFRHYIAQDVHFHKAFAQAIDRKLRHITGDSFGVRYELAEECADDDDAKSAISNLRKSVMEELKLHDSFVQEWGSDLVKESTINAATVKYTGFLLATASGKVDGVKGPGKLSTPFERTKVAAYTIGAMTPRMRLYAYLGKELQAFLDADGSSHVYKKWIDSYSFKGFEASALQIEDLLDKLSVTLTGEELDIIEKLYHQAMKLEIEFFTAQPLAQKTVVPLSKELNPADNQLMLFSDFDLTCTVVDSSAILAEIAIITAPKSDQNQSENQIARMLSADLRNTWGVLSKQYTEEYEQCIENLMPVEKAVAFNYEGLRKALEQLSDFERMANSRVIESGVLKGLNLEDIKRAGEHLIFQDGCKVLFQNILKNENLNANVNVLSYCWCADLIRSAFSSGMFRESATGIIAFYYSILDSAGALDALNVHANEFAHEDSISTGEIVRKVETPIDKVEAFNNILKNCSNDKKNVTVYIGDSVGDLLCLLEADIGIVIGTSSSLRKVGTQFGVSFVPLFPGLVKKQKGFDEEKPPSWKGLSGVLYTVESWAEIHAFILGP
ncbi:Thiaminase-2/PQQC [Dillenia turbinata]|uniref:Thiaminase-2/PQQC n=1 Tax=Dillenia turbinata TaxID=194707 RepID=A0AAN8YSR0_9MAGN